MNCTQAASLVPAYADGELDSAQSVVVEKHLLGCAECRVAHDALTTLRQKLKAEVQYYRAPAALRQQLREHFPAIAGRGDSSDRYRERRRWLFAGAMAGVAATLLVGWIGTLAWRSVDGQPLAQEAVNAHVRATLGDRLVAVASSDRHTVRPWLSARLDFSPSVLDLDGEGFFIVGARLDSLDGRPVAALVYRRRDHIIDVFVRPEVSSTGHASMQTIRGFNVAQATGTGMQWWAVSDLNAEELTVFVNRLARGE